ncbi:MAG: hypothetical protein JWM85_1354 [Acidimicrobiaceae bacterium]|nr:hypothetical protein [Acidimicrobiaceae bacterium]
MNDLVRRAAYDADRALELNEESCELEVEAVVRSLAYDDGSGGRASALVVTADEASVSPRAGVILAHGGFEGGKHLFRSQAVRLAKSGYVVLVADTVFPREGDVHHLESAAGAAVRTHRRGLDLLQQVYGVNRLMFFGHSRGGSEAAVLAAVEQRLDGIVLAGVGVPHPDSPVWDPARYEVATAALECLRESGRRRLLIQHGRRDEIISVDRAQALFDVASEPKLWKVYDCGHDIDAYEPAYQDRMAFYDNR